MELGLQFGWGMMEHCRTLLRAWGGGCVVLSPRDLKPEQLQSLAADIRGISGGRVLLDAQFYVPRSDHERLTSHGYWPSAYQTNTFFGGPGMADMIRDIVQLTGQLGCEAFIVPGPLATQVDDTWLGITRELARAAVGANSGLPVYLTVALGWEPMRSLDAIQEVLEELRALDLPGVYLLAEHPNGQYLVDDPVWLSNLVELVAGLRLQGKRVLVGYSSHQQLCLAAAGANTIASGTYMNVRAFSPDRFVAAQEEEIRRKTTWYYAPTTLSEFKIPSLDMAHRAGILAQMQPPASFGMAYCAPLFQGLQPTSVGFGEPDAFRHYLDCLRHQTLGARAATFDDTIALHRRMLDDAESELDVLAQSGVLPGARGFGDALDAVRAALASLVGTRGPALRRHWAQL